MTRVLLTGMSGTGKSSVVAELRRRGWAAIDMDETGWWYRDAAGHQRWNEPRLERALDAAGDRPLVVGGCSESQRRFYPRFGHVVLLSAPEPVLVERLRTRMGNPYGKRPEELAEVRHHLRTVEPLLRRRAELEIVTTAPLAEVVATLLAHVAPSP